MRRQTNRGSLVGSRPVRLVMVGAVLAATGALTVTFVSSGGNGTADAATSLDQFVPIENVQPNVNVPQPQAEAATGRFTVDCGTNGNGKFSPDNPVAQPGIKNGAEHLHDFVGNLAITANSSDAELAASGTTCRNGDRSSYFWPVVRIDRSVRSDAQTRQALAQTRPTVDCPQARDRVTDVPDAARSTVERKLAELDRLTAAANDRMGASQGRIDVELNNRILDRLRTLRAGLLRRISTAITTAGGSRPTGLVSLVDCTVGYDGMHATMHHSSPPADATDAPASPSNDPASPGNDPTGPSSNPASPSGNPASPSGNPASPSGNPASPSGAPSTSPSALPEPQGRNLELPTNTGGIVRPAAVLIEYRGNATSKVVPMPKFLRALTGDAKPTSRGPANARATWTCSGFADRLSDKYPICPAGQRVQRVQDFPGCWDGKNIDSDNHRKHVAFADRNSGACPEGFVAIPQLRITISYDIPRDVQEKGQYALDSFPEENHNPFSDHNDFVNVNSRGTMQLIADCINRGKSCR